MKAWITYSFEDNQFVEKLKNGLTDDDVEFIDIESEILPGDNIVERVYSNISQADIIFVVLSKHGSQRKWFSTEIGILISEISQNPTKSIIPILKDREAEIPSFINQYQYVDLSSPEKFEKGVLLLKSVFQRKREKQEGVKISKQKYYGGGDIQASGDISINILKNQESLLKKEQEEYEKHRKEKQRIYFFTLFVTVIASVFMLTAFILSNNKFLKIDSDNYIAIILSTITGMAIGILIKTFSDRLKGRE